MTYAGIERKQATDFGGPSGGWGFQIRNSRLCHCPCASPASTKYQSDSAKRQQANGGRFWDGRGRKNNRKVHAGKIARSPEWIREGESKLITRRNYDVLKN